MAATAATSLSLSFLPKPNSSLFFSKNVSHISLLRKFHPHKIHNLPLISSTNNIQNSWKISSISENFLLSEANPPAEQIVSTAETTDQIVSSTSDDGVSTIISALLFVAFVGLSILTIGVIYIAVTDFLTKREKEKFEKEEAAKRKKSSGRKGKIVARSARAGPKGFGQKFEEPDDNDD
ncbi:PREDICTED: uncharacterized protein LOC109244883 [Nicotiana attenuata]|uniref:Transmembrane protein n=1 Tax=Nicotiana attenuata TaxID=49451 RepID=A0A1J6IRL4_NICAT|nr:PREDICTED: uncharacterized protein LOC109244883 [Nicotiana attenuata]XP_019267685.1 PREDICTED: uncharacterized protein LOC109244883 [Nicotiana attenuata]OIT07354.1 hypothetical protein A4A49_01373 [Nicotiana attenuata]